MISTRGPDQILVVDRNGAPVREICGLLIRRNTISSICKRFDITREEMYAAVSAINDLIGISDNDFIEIEISREGDEINVETTGITDLIFLTLLTWGNFFDPDEDEIDTLFQLGMSEVIADILGEIKLGGSDYLDSDIHSIIAREFFRAYGPSLMDDIDFLLENI